MVEGFDCSAWTGGVDFRAARAAGMEFCYCRVGRGVPAPPSTDADGLDVHWDANRDAALAAGLKVGGYWRFFPGVGMTGQVERFCDRLDGTSMSPMVDIEDQHPDWSVEDFTAWTLTVLQSVEDRTGMVPLLYTYRWFLANALQADRLLPRWPLGLAAWTGVTGDWPDPRAVLWQHAGNVAEPWAAGNVDLDRMKED